MTDDRKKEFARTEISAAKPPSGSGIARTVIDSQPPVHQPTAPRTQTGGAGTAPAHFTGLELVPGTRLNQFELIRELGRGGMGQVFLARDTRLARLVALQFLGAATGDLTTRFLIEARATAKAQHENIVVIYEADEWNGHPYMALEFLEGEALSATIEGKTLPASRAIELIVPVVRALARAHEHGIVHCDLKPDNIFVTREGVVKVLDFGIARALGGGAVATPDGEGISGTMPYMSPEQWGADDIDPRTDLWAVGIILWEMLTGKHPLDPISPQKLWHAAAMPDQAMPRVRTALPSCPPALEAIIDRCLAKRKDGRFASARELGAALEPLLPGRYGRRLAEGENPFPGMTAFQEGDADRFFGRDRDVTAMIARLAEAPLVAVVAPSGVGKSSFLRAGVIPALKASGDAWEVFVARPGRTPLASLAHALGGALEDDTLAQRLRAEPGLLGTMLRQRAREKREKIFLYVDQFEELYTLCPDLDERRAFTACLSGMADDAASPLRVVVSMRSDFLDRVAEDRAFLDRLTRGLLFLPPIDRDGMREALRAPLDMCGFGFESETIVDDMVDQLASSPGALPLLQFTAARLWDARDRERRVLTQASYQEIGGVAGALATHADQVLASMTPERQKLTRAVFLRLVTADGTRAIVDVDELGAGAEVLDQLVAARLLSVQTREDGHAVEIVHESLITRWPTFRRWIEESAEDAAFLEQLRTAARQWDSRGRAEGLLWSGDAMEDARTFARRFKGELPARERAFLDAVLALATRAARRRRRMMIAAFVVLGALVAAAIVVIVMVRSAEQEAERQKSNAETEMHRATEAEAKVSTQLETITAQMHTIEEKDRAREQAEQAKSVAEMATEEAQAQKAAEAQKLDVAESQVAMTNQDLQDANKKLRGALEAAKGAQARAEEATAKAEKANQQLQVSLDREKAEVKRLEDEKKKLSTTLKP